MTYIRKQTALWTTKDGIRLRICDMTDTHLLNAARMMRRQAGLIKAEALNMAGDALSMFQGEMAQLHVEQEFNRLLDADPEDVLPEIYQKLLWEIERRGLDSVFKNRTLLYSRIRNRISTAGSSTVRAAAS